MDKNVVESPQTADEVREQMQSIRQDLGQDVEELVEHAEQLMDWQYYVRSYPWTMMGAAAMLGYWVVPRRRVWRADQATLDRLAQSLPEREVPTKPTPGFLSSILTVGTNYAMRAALAYVGQQAARLLADRAGQWTGSDWPPHHANSSGYASSS